MPWALPPSLAQRVPRRSKARPFAAGTPVANTVAVVDAVPGRSTKIVSLAGALPPVTYSRPSGPKAMPLGEHGPGSDPDLGRGPRRGGDPPHRTRVGSGAALGHVDVPAAVGGQALDPARGREDRRPGRLPAQRRRVGRPRRGRRRGAAVTARQPGQHAGRGRRHGDQHRRPPGRTSLHAHVEPPPEDFFGLVTDTSYPEVAVQEVARPERHRPASIRTVMADDVM